ncbi:hypothetical protein SeLEV6574_g02161 [Synchytrium endobioticum]|uniref:Small ribosomal subunit protein uS9m n=1 Tax=Synchytrium endobioticum TaxID=286115 RepID=A0A507D9C9_9FUNG|nr:hypothetical protein SeLEV6574_g02161 [Synchytrium endobioticum]
MSSSVTRRVIMPSLLLQPSGQTVTCCNHRIIPNRGSSHPGTTSLPSIRSVSRCYSTVESGLHPAYFTGDPKYYDALIKVNNTLKERGFIDFTSAKPYEGTKTPAWMSMDDLKRVYGFRMDEVTYDSFIHRLNLLYTKRFKEVPVEQKTSSKSNDGTLILGHITPARTIVKEADSEVMALLNRFVRLGRDLSIEAPPPSTIDSDGKAYAYASRKTAKSQVWIIPGEGQVYVNGITLGEYFKNTAERDAVIKPMVVSDTLGKYNVWALAKGGGLSGQAGAIQVAVARALVVHEPLLAAAFKEAGLTKVDTRQVERKKTGLPKARKRYTWVKR